MQTSPIIDYTYTVDDQIHSFERYDLTCNRMVLKDVFIIDQSQRAERCSDILVLKRKSLLDKYSNDLRRIVRRLTLSVSEQNLYFYHPWLLSYDLYGTPELWEALLDLNSLTSSIYFTVNPLLIYDQGRIAPIITEIFNLDREIITENTGYVFNETK